MRGGAVDLALDQRGVVQHPFERRMFPDLLQRLEPAATLHHRSPLIAGSQP